MPKRRASFELPRSISRDAALAHLDRISARIDELASRRSALWTTVRDDASRAEIREIERRIERLWEAYRWLRGAAVHGSHQEIVYRARVESELERSLKRERDRIRLEATAS